MRIRPIVLVPATGLALLVAAALPAPILRAGANVAATMIEVEGEGAKYWTRWRGPSGQGLVKDGKYTDKWSPTQGVKWKVPVPGRGHSSPIVWGDHLFITTAREDGARVSMLAFRRSDGKPLWERVVPTKAGIEHVYQKNSHASATAVTDGTLVYASFGTHGLMAVDFNGRIAWHNPVGRLANTHGSAGSPVLYKDRIFLYQDHKGTEATGAYVGAFDKKTGKQIWKTNRVETVGWGTPVVIRAGDRDELIVSSQRKVYGYDPQTGKELWTVSGLGFEVIPTPVVAEGLILCSSGRQGPTIAIRPGGSGDVTATHVAWTSPKGSPFIPSGVVVDGVLYLVNDIQSIVTAHDVKTGQVIYQGRLGDAKREGFSASPIALNRKVFFTNDDGETFVLQAGREFKLLHVNTLGEQTLASPALVDGRWYFRTAASLLAIE
ncbi:MAG: PQQ-binding-like beta-propeller repeat protein [Acidobacteria bacterium]|nr:PQQ-binding-like beta-propeller repeat protein [Acidobacteriota bacterium]